MKLNKKQRKEIKRLIPYFEKLELRKIDQKRYGSHPYKTKKELKERFKNECGVCFGVHLASIYKIAQHDKEAGFWYCFTNGQFEFLKRLGIKTEKQRERLYSFMQDCGVHQHYPFGNKEWTCQPKDVLKNMLTGKVA